MMRALLYKRYKRKQRKPFFCCLCAKLTRFQSVRQRMQVNLPSLPAKSKTALRLKQQKKKNPKKQIYWS